MCAVSVWFRKVDDDDDNKSDGEGEPGRGKGLHLLKTKVILLVEKSP